jgi:hypothetical protein
MARCGGGGVQCIDTECSERIQGMIEKVADDRVATNALAHRVEQEAIKEMSSDVSLYN